MSSIATFYILPESKRPEFSQARQNQKTVTYKRGFFSTKKIETGDRYLWEYLDSAASEREEFPFSGFILIDYLFTFVADAAPIELMSIFKHAALDENYYVFASEAATRLAGYLESHPPESDRLESFLKEQGGNSPEDVKAMQDTHDYLITWFRRISTDSFGVMHLTF